MSQARPINPPAPYCPECHAKAPAHNIHCINFGPETLVEDYSLSDYLRWCNGQLVAAFGLPRRDT